MKIIFMCRKKYAADMLQWTNILPDWRGTVKYNITILNKLSEWSATAHYVDGTWLRGAA